MATTVAATSSFTGIRLSDVYSTSGRVVARFDFGGKKAAKKVSKPTFDRPLWYPGAPAEYLQYDLDSLDQNLAKNMASDIIGTRTEVTDIKPTPFQPYSKVFGLQRFRESELIHGRWAMLATLALVIGYIEFERNAELDPEKRLYLGGKYFDPLGLASDPEKKVTHQLAEIKHAHLAMVAFLGFAVQAATTGKGSLNNWATHLSDPLHTTIIDTGTS
ncbi:hypothetical protein Gogos_002206 [Gossypium gossypioides]|uniref:Chlorophyll a-b binding protein, chloroplastic n=1 Tax=Gossypium gossypioides TaxID=34282 RepID=A0A7J9CQY9_GOSGO|nr:hypothetical protein [Gossypium gossypioides]